MESRFKTQVESKNVVVACLKAFLIVVLVSGLFFLYLMQRVKSRELERDLAGLKKEQAEVVKELNLLDASIERLKRPERIKTLARELLGMREP